MKKLLNKENNNVSLWLEVIDLQGNIGIVVNCNDLHNIIVKNKETGFSGNYNIDEESDKYERLWITKEHNTIDYFNNKLATDEGNEINDKYIGKIKKKREIKKSQLERFHLKYSNKESFSFIVEKIIEKYESDAYKDREYGKCGRMPNTELYYFLCDYAEKYGRELTDKELKKYSNDFTGEIYYVHGYYIQKMYGQGCVVRIDHEKEKNK